MNVLIVVLLSIAFLGLFSAIGVVIYLKVRSEKKSVYRPPMVVGEPRLVADLDKIVAGPIPFRVNGEIHYLKPIEMGEFAHTAEAMAAVLEKIAGPNALEKVDFEQAIDMYARIVGTVCDTIDRKFIASLPMPVARGLLQLVYDHIMGRLTDEKKTLVRATQPPKPQPSSS